MHMILRFSWVFSFSTSRHCSLYADGCKERNVRGNFGPVYGLAIFWNQIFAISQVGLAFSPFSQCFGAFQWYISLRKAMSSKNSDSIVKKNHCFSWKNDTTSFRKSGRNTIIPFVLGAANISFYSVKKACWHFVRN